MTNNYYSGMGAIDPNALPVVNPANAMGWTLMTATTGAILGFIFLDTFEKVIQTKERLKTGVAIGALAGAVLGIATSGGTYLYQQA